MVPFRSVGPSEPRCLLQALPGKPEAKDRGGPAALGYCARRHDPRVPCRPRASLAAPEHPLLTAALLDPLGRPLISPYFTAPAPTRAEVPPPADTPSADWLPLRATPPCPESAASEGTEAGRPLRPVRGFRGGGGCTRLFPRRLQSSRA